nr:hypothetical protein [uncultured Microbacterium sp.]
MPPQSRLSPADKQNISQVLVGLAKAATRIVDECQLSKPPEGSSAHAWFSSLDPPGMFPHVMQGFLHVEFAMLSGADHLRALNTLVRADPLLTTSTATVMRGGLEAFAKSWYFNTSAGVEEFVFRYLSSRYSEYRYPRLFKESLRTYDGRVVNPEIEAAEALAELERIGLGRPERVDISGRVAALVNAAHGQDHGRKDYSGLSSVAHAEHVGLGNFLTFDPSSGRATLAHRRDLLMDMLASLCLSVLECLEALVRVFGSQPGPVALLDQNSERSLAALLRLFSVDNGASEDHLSSTTERGP